MYLKSLSAASAILAFVAASPTDYESKLEERGVTMRVDQVQRNTDNKLPSGASQVASTFRKFKKAVPDNVLAAAAAQGSVTASPSEYDGEYDCPVTVGTPGVTLPLDFDTGSSDLWVFSSELPASERSGHAYYTSSSSSTSKLDSGETWDISYGDGSGAQGNIYIDKVTIGGVTVTSQAVEAAESVSSEFVSDTSNDGLVGFAFDSINTASPNHVQTWFGNAEAQLASPVFTANLKKGKAGNYNFGYIDSSEYTGSITYAAINTANGFWEFTASGYAVGSGAFSSQSIDVIADTGTTLIYLPAAIVKAYYAKVSGSSNSASAGGYIFPCSATLPSLTIGIGSYKAVVPGTFLNYAPNSGSTCFGGLQSNAGIGLSILGDVFLKSQFVVFNQGVPKIGFAPGVSKS